MIGGDAAKGLVNGEATSSFRAPVIEGEAARGLVNGDAASPLRRAKSEPWRTQGARANPG